MVKRGMILIGVALILILSLQLISAEISFSQTQKIYNLGDDFDIIVYLSASQNTNDFLKATLVCGSSDVLLYMAPTKLASGEQASVPISFRLEKSLIGTSSGDCSLKAEYSKDSSTTDSFEISNELTLSTNIDKSRYDPGESILISGTASKKNGKPFVGKVEIAIPGLNIDENVDSSNGGFSYSIPIPDNTKYGAYLVSIKATESIDNEVTNSGESSQAFSINQIVKSLDLSADSTTIIPGSNIDITAKLKDQTGEEILGKTISIDLINPSNETLSSLTTNSGEKLSIPTLSNTSAGAWSLIASYYYSLNSSIQITISELEKASFELINNTLVVKNIGNAPYNKTIQVSIGNESKPLNILLSIGESAQFVLEAPDGQYSIGVDDGTQTNLGSAFLTGRVIDVKSLTDAASSGYMIVGWIVIILVILWFIYKSYKKRKNPTESKSNYFSPIKLGPSSPPSSTKDSSPMLNATSISHGEKKECAVIALKVKNMSELKSSNSNALESINIALSKARAEKASVFEQNDFRIMVIPASVARDNLASIAAKVTLDVEKVLSEHNKKYNQKIEFGVGANVGELIVERTNNKFKFGTIGTTISLARKIADSAKDEALISEPLRTKAMKDIKVQRKGDYYSVLSIKNSSQHSEFIAKFMQRQKQG